MTVVVTAKYLGLDPGKTTGWAKFNADGYVIGYGQLVGEDALLEFLEELEDTVEEVFVEDYIINPNIRQGGKRPVASEAIGYIKSHCKRKKLKLTLVRNTVKSLGYKWAGITQAKSHSKSHERDAIAIGTYQLVKTGIRPTNLKLRYDRENNNGQTEEN